MAKRHKTAAKGKADARPAGASTGAAARHGAKHGKGHGRQAEPADDYVPMNRAKRGSAPLERPTREVARATRGGKRHGTFVSEPAPLVSSNHHHGRPLADARSADRDEAAVTSRAARPIVAAHHAAPPAHDTRPADMASSRPPASIVTAHADAFQGVSHPDDDERLPRPKNETDSDENAPTAAAAPIAHISAAPSATPTVPLPQTPVVQGFGGEVAVPSAAPNDRPGGTRRRNHPSNWQPESMVSQPEPLEEREALTEAAVSPAVLPEIYDRTGHLVMPAPLKGSHDVLVHQNLMATSDGLERIYDDADLERLRAAHLLVSFPVNETLRVNEELPSNRRVARTWTVVFAADTARAYYARFHQPLWVTSAVRTVHYQAHLQMVNGNAAATSGDAASPHLTGQAIDLGKRGMSHAQLAWMRDYLLPLMRAGKIDVEEEFQQACFHISVYRSYTGSRHGMREYAQVRPTQAGDGPTAADTPEEQ